MEKAKKIFKEYIIYVLIILMVILIRTYFITPVRVSGSSMYPNYKNGQILLLNKLEKKFKRFDVVVIKYGKESIIKRIIGLPGEYIEYKDNKLYVNGKYIKEPFLNSSIITNDFNTIDSFMTSYIPKGYYLVLGDNRQISKDSRMIGLIKEEDIKGKPTYILYPFTQFKKIKN